MSTAAASGGIDQDNSVAGALSRRKCVISISQSTTWGGGLVSHKLEEKPTARKSVKPKSLRDHQPRRSIHPSTGVEPDYISRSREYVIDPVEYNNAGLSKVIKDNQEGLPLDPAAAKQLDEVRKIDELVNKALQRNLNTIDWSASLPSREGFSPNKQYKKWKRVGLSGFGLMVWIRNFCCHVGKSLRRGLFEDRDDAVKHARR